MNDESSESMEPTKGVAAVDNSCVCVFVCLFVRTLNGKWFEPSTPVEISHGTGSYFVIQRPSDPGIQRPGDPVDLVTLFYNELQMSTYV